MRALDAEEREAMVIAMTPDNAICPHCGAPIVGDGIPVPGHCVAAVYRLAKRGLVRMTACPPQLAMHFDATPLGRTVYRIATGVEVT